LQKLNKGELWKQGENVSLSYGLYVAYSTTFIVSVVCCAQGVFYVFSLRSCNRAHSVSVTYLFASSCHLLVERLTLPRAQTTLFSVCSSRTKSFIYWCHPLGWFWNIFNGNAVAVRPQHFENRSTLCQSWDLGCKVQKSPEKHHCYFSGETIPINFPARPYFKKKLVKTFGVDNLVLRIHSSHVWIRWCCKLSRSIIIIAINGVQAMFFSWRLNKIYFLPKFRSENVFTNITTKSFRNFLQPRES